MNEGTCACACILSNLSKPDGNPHKLFQHQGYMRRDHNKANYRYKIEQGKPSGACGVPEAMANSWLCVA